MRRLLTSTLAAAVMVASASAALAATGDAAPSSSSAQGTYVAVAPARLYDSGADPRGPLKQGEVRTIQVSGRGEVPQAGDVEAAALNVTVAQPTRSGFVAAFPSDSAGTGVSSVTFAPGERRGSLVTAATGPDGAIKVRNAPGSGAGTVRVVVDIQGYYLSKTATPATTAADFFPTAPTRVANTRQDPDQDGVIAPLDPQATLLVDVGLSSASGDGLDLADVDALAVNLLAVTPSAQGYLVAYDGNGDLPPTTSVNFSKGRTTSNMAVVPVQRFEDDLGKYVEFGIANGGSAPVHVIAEVYGVYAHDQSGGLRFEPLPSPVRIVDGGRRTGIPVLGARQTGTVTAPSSVASPGDASTEGSTQALVGSLTAKSPTATTYLTSWALTDDRPATSNVNAVARQTVSNHAYINLSDAGQFNIYNNAGSTNVLFDVTGRFTVPTSTSDGAQGVAAQRRRETVEAPAPAKVSLRGTTTSRRSSGG